MYRVILSLELVLLVAGVSPEPKHCVHRTMMCCKTNMGVESEPNELKRVMRECFNAPPKPESCDFDLCVGQKMGYASPTGTIIKEGYIKTVENMFENATDLVDLLKTYCANGDISVYGENICDLKKLQICSGVQYLKLCDNWSDESRCKGAEEDAMECIKKFE